MFDIANVTPLYTMHCQTRALENWRRAARLVDLRWRQYVSADRTSRRFAFASYVAALDAEESAASEMSVVCDGIAA